MIRQNLDIGTEWSRSATFPDEVSAQKDVAHLLKNNNMREYLLLRRVKPMDDEVPFVI